MKSAIECLKAMGLVSWQTLSAGWDRGWVERPALTEYAVSRLEANNLDDPAMIALADAGHLDADSINKALIHLVGEQTEPNSHALDSWRLALLLELNQSRAEWDEKVAKLEELSMQFDYPEDMQFCTRYGPSSQAVDSGLATTVDINADPLDSMLKVIAGLKQKLGIL